MGRLKFFSCQCTTVHKNNSGCESGRTCQVSSSALANNCSQTKCCACANKPTPRQTHTHTISIQAIAWTCWIKWSINIIIGLVGVGIGDGAKIIIHMKECIIHCMWLLLLGIVWPSHQYSEPQPNSWFGHNQSEQNVLMKAVRLFIFGWNLFLFARYALVIPR